MTRLMRRMTIAFSLAAGITVALLVVIVIAALLIDADAYRPRVQTELTHLLGREVALERLTVGWSLRPTLAVQGLRVANPGWASRPDMLLANSAALRLDLVELIHGRIEIGSVTVQGLDLLLERNAEGAGNWEFAVADEQPKQADAAPLPNFHAISLRDALIGWRRGAEGVISARIETAKAVVRADRPFELDTRLVFRDVPLEAEVRAGVSLHDVLAGQSLSGSIALRALDTRADFEVSLPELTKLQGLSLNFAAKGNQLDAWSTLLGRALPAWGPYRVSGRTAFAADGVRVSDLRVLVDGLSGTTPLAVSALRIDAGELLFGPEVATSLQLSGRLDERPFEIDATTANLEQVVAFDGTIPVAANVTLEGFAFGAEGELSASASQWSLQVAAQVNGDAAVAARLVNVAPFPRALQVDLSAQIAADANRFTATGLRGSLAQCSVAGDLALQRAEPLRLSGALELGRLNLAAFEPAPDKARPTRTRDRQPAGEPAWMRALNVDVRLRVDEVLGLPVAASGLSGHGLLQGGRLTLQQFRGSLAGTRLVADGALQWRGQRPYLKANVGIPVIDAAILDTRAGAADNGGNGVKVGPLDTALPFALLREADVDLQLEIGRVDGMPVSVSRLRSTASLSSGRLSVPSLSVTVAGIASQTTIVLDASRDRAQFRATGKLRQVDLGRLSKELDQQWPVSGLLEEANVTLDTGGANLRAWIRSAKLRAQVNAARLRLRERDEALTVERASVIAGPDVPVRLQLHGQFEDYPLDATASGGLLAEFVDADQPWPRLSTELRTVVREQPVRLSATSALTPLRKGRNVPIRVELHGPGGYVIAAGTIDDVREAARTPLSVEASAKSLSNLPLLLNQSPLPDIPLTASARARVDDEIVSLEALQLRAGQTDLSGSVRLDRKGRIKLSADLGAALLDLRPWLPAPPQPAAQQQTTTQPNKAAKKQRKPKQKPATEKTAGRADRPFELQVLRKFDVALRLQARRVISHRLEVNDFSLRGDLENGQLAAVVSIAEGSSSLVVQADARTDKPVMVVHGKTDNLNLESLKPDAVAIRQSGFPRVSASVRLAGAGATPSDVIASASGEALFSAGPGQLVRSSQPFVVQAVSADLLETLMPGQKPDDYSQLECAAAHFDVANGVASSPDGIALRFKRVDILGSGAVNLATREILFGFKAVRRRWLSFSVLDVAGDFARVGGTLGQPRVELDTGGVLFKGGAAWATGGLSLLATSFLRKWGASENPCSVIVEKGRTDSDPIDSLIESLPAPLKNLPLPGNKPKPG